MARRRSGGSGGFMKGYNARAAAGARQMANDRRRRKNESDRADRQRRGGWTPARKQNPDVGVIADTDEVVSFKIGGLTGDQTLIADGDFSAGDGTGAEQAWEGFNATHNHYGSDSGGDGYFSEDRGFYTGPDH